MSVRSPYLTQPDRAGHGWHLLTVAHLGTSKGLVMDSESIIAALHGESTDDADAKIVEALHGETPADDRRTREALTGADLTGLGSGGPDRSNDWLAKLELQAVQENLKNSLMKQGKTPAAADALVSGHTETFYREAAKTQALEASRLTVVVGKLRGITQ